MADNIENGIVKSAEVSLIVVFLFNMMFMVKTVTTIFIDKLPAVTGIVGLKFHASAISG